MRNVRSLLQENSGLALAAAIAALFVTVAQVGYAIFMRPLMLDVLNGRTVLPGMGARPCHLSPQAIRYVLMLTDNLLGLLVYVPVFLALALILFMIRQRTSLLDIQANPEANPAASRRRLFLLLAAVLLVVGVPSLLLRPEGVFFSGDGGVKYMQIVSLIDSGFRRFSLDWPASDWVKSLWSRYDAFPLQPPFVHETPAGLFIVYPMAFELLSSVAFLAFGFKGLMMWPIAGALGLCAVLWFVWRNDRYVMFKVLGVILCTPVVFYSKLFWEHAVALPFVAAGLLLLPRAKTNREFFLAGLALETSLFFRSEAVVFFPVCLMLLLWKPRPEVGWFYVGMFTTTVAYLLFNRFIFGTFMPPHAVQMVQNPLFMGAKGVFWLSEMLRSLVHVAPCLLLGLWALFGQDRDDKMIFSIAAACILVTAFISPAAEISDFGPRYLVTFTPFLAYVAMNVTFSFRRRGVVLLCGGLWMLCFWTTYVEAGQQQDRHLWSRTYPAARQVERVEGVGAILVGHTYIAQEFAVPLYGRNVVRVTQQTYPAIMKELSDRGIRTVLLIAYPDGRWGSFRYEDNPDIPYQGRVLGVFGEYQLVKFTR